MSQKKKRARRQEPTWQWRVAQAVKIIVTTSRTPLYLMEQAVLKATREAIDMDVSSEGRMYRDCPPDLLPPDAPDDKLLSMAGIFRLILVNDVPNWRDPMRAETFMAEVQRALGSELAKVRPTF